MGHITIDGEKFYVETKIYNSLLQGNKRYRERNKEKHKLKMKEYHEKENEKIQNELYEYYEKTGHKIILDKKRTRTPSETKYFEPNENFICECGSKIKYYVNFKRHLKTIKHNKYIEYNKSFNKLTHIPDFNKF